MKEFDRRELLKLLTLCAFSAGMPHYLGGAARSEQAARPNVLIVLFDALSAYHLQVYGYDRQTMPNLTRLLERGTVYHNHFSNGNFTTPGTASLLTGVLPWTHRALGLYGTVAPEWQDRQLFNLFTGHNRIAYSHNPLVDTLLRQFRKGLDTYVPFQELLLSGYWLADLFGDDFDMASVAFDRIVENEGGVSNSLFLKRVYQDWVFRSRDLVSQEYRQDFPRGVPTVVDIPYDLETGINWVIKNIGQLPQPFLGYFHFFPPHNPYRPHRRVYETFYADGFNPIEKPEHPYFSMGVSAKDMNRERRLYDEFILYCDDEFGRLFSHLEQSGVLENTWVIFTSDHGELFERKIIRHTTRSLHQPIVRVPLVIFGPGQQQREDIYQPTSAIDIVPTLLALNNYEIPDWLEGDVLPPYRGNDALSSERKIYAVHGRGSQKYGPLIKSSIMMVKGPYKLTRYIGYDELDQTVYYEMFNIQEDPNELVDLIALEPEAAQALIKELEAEVTKANARYLEGG